MFKIRLYPIKSYNLCCKCIYALGKECSPKHCDACVNYNDGNCYCGTLNAGDPCKHFKRA